jgi:hypothetical protein
MSSNRSKGLGTWRAVESVDRLLILLILLTAAVIRFSGLGSLSLSNDELSAMTRADYPTASAMYDSGALLDGHPAGVQIFLFYWIRFFGDGVFAVRFPFALCSLLSIFLVWQIGRKWFSPFTGLMAAAFFACFEYPLLYSVLARSYSPGLLFSLATVYFWSGLTERLRAGEDIPFRSAFPFLFSLAIGVHTHYFTVLFLFLVCVSGFFFLPRSRFLRYFLFCSVGAVSFLAELPFLMDLLEVGGLGDWLGRPDAGFLFRFFKHVFNGSLLITVLFFLPALLGVILRSDTVRWNARHTLSIAWFLVSFLIAYTYSVLVQPILQPSTLYFTFPFVLMAVFSFWPERQVSGIGKVLPVVIVLLAGSWSTLASNRFFTSPPFGVFREVAEDLASWKKEGQRLPSVVNVVDADYIGYYFRRSAFAPAEVSYKVESASDLARLRERVDTCTANSFAYVWTNNFHPYEIGQIIRRRYPRIVDERHYFNAESRLYSSEEGKLPVNPLRTWQVDYNDTSLTGFSIRYDSTSISAPGLMAFRKGVDYAPDISERVPTVGNGFSVLYTNVWFRSASAGGNQCLAISFEDKGEPVWWESVRLNDYNLRPGSWQQAFLAKPLPSGHDSLDIKVYLWNPDGEEFEADDLHAELRSEVDPYVRK